MKTKADVRAQRFWRDHSPVVRAGKINNKNHVYVLGLVKMAGHDLAKCLI